jgi:hypothetical protein
MDDDSLRDLLLRTDSASPPPTGHDADGWIVEADRRLRGRKRRNAAGVAFALMAVFGIGVRMYLQMNDVRRRVIPPAIVFARTVPAQVKSPVAELESATLRLNALLSAERREAVFARLDRLKAQTSPALWIADQREDTARIMLVSVASADSRNSEADVYHQVIDLFPDTAAAAVARQRLGDLQ